MFNLLKRLLGIGPKADLGAMIREGAIVLDVRTPAEYKGGHVKGSVNIPLDQLKKSLNRLPDKNRPIITCCASGMRSASAKGVLLAKGYTHVHNGGSWQHVKQLKG